MTRLAAWLIFVLVFCASAQAQFILPEGRSLSRPLPNRKRPVQADVTLKITHESQWGPIVLTETGRYWRDTKGHARLDNGHGITYLRDDAKSTFTIIDHQQRRIYQEDWKVRSRDTMQRGTLAAEPIATFTGNRKLTKIGSTTLDGLKVTLYNNRVRDVVEQQFYSSDLKLPVLLRATYTGTEMEQRFKNIREEKPDPALFDLPSGYPMRIVQLGSQLNTGRCQISYADKISGEPKTSWVRAQSVNCLLPPELAPLSPPTAADPPLSTDAIGSSAVSLAVEVMQGSLPLEGLSAKDFVLRDEGTRRPVRMAPNSDPPLDIVVVSAPNMFYQLTRSPDNSFHALRTIRTQDRVSVVTPGLLPRISLPFTNDRAAIETALNDASAGVPEFDPSGLSTRLTLEYAYRLLLNNPSLSSTGRRRIILMFWGQLPAFSDESFIENLAAANIAFLFAGTLPSRTPLQLMSLFTTYRVGDAEHIARATGGSTATTDSPGVVDLIERQRRRYVLQFDPAAGAAPNQVRRVSVELSEEARSRYPNATVNARELYVVP